MPRRTPSLLIIRDLCSGLAVRGGVRAKARRLRACAMCGCIWICVSKWASYDRVLYESLCAALVKWHISIQRNRCAPAVLLLPAHHRTSIQPGTVYQSSRRGHKHNRPQCPSTNLTQLDYQYLSLLQCYICLGLKLPHERTEPEVFFRYILFMCTVCTIKEINKNHLICACCMLTSECCACCYPQKSYIFKANLPTLYMSL